MNNRSTQPSAHETRRQNAPILPFLALCLILCACTTPTQHSVKSLTPLDRAPLARIQREIVENSRSLAAESDALRGELTAGKPAVALPMAAPVLDPLESEMITLKMYNATPGQLFAALADQAHLNLIVDPAVLLQEKRADLYLNNVTLREAVDEILRAFDIVGEIKGHTLRVELTGERIMSLDFLSTAMTMTLSSGGNVFGSSSASSGAGGGAGGGNNALTGNFSLSGNNGLKTDPYEQFEAAVKHVLGEGNPAEKREEKTDKKEGGADGAAAKSGNTYSLNRISGTLYLKARPSKLHAVEKLLERTQKVMKRQVQIDAQLIDVKLNDNFNMGVDWTALRDRLAAGYGVNPLALAASASNFPAPGLQSGGQITIPAHVIGGNAAAVGGGLAYQGKNISAVLNALRSFGNLEVLSNPSVRVRNGTPALLTVGTTTNYVSSSSSTVTNPGGGASTTSASVQTNSVFSGVMIGVIPFIAEDGKVDMLVNPMQTEVSPASMQLVSAGGGNSVTLPVVDYKGMSTTLMLRDGDTVMIGGLIDQRRSLNDQGAPGLSDTPLFGWAFGNQSKTHSNRELVMVLRVNVL